MLKPIPGFRDYLASTDGQIYSLKQRIGNRWQRGNKPRRLEVRCNPRGYRVVGLSDTNCIVRWKKVCIFILLTFRGKRPPGFHACHGVNGKTDDSLKNLYWGTIQQNLGADKRRDGTMQCGERNGRAKLTVKKVRFIRSHYIPRSKKWGGCALAKQFKINATNMYGIIHGHHWKTF